jgi:hypothetical protein
MWQESHRPRCLKKDGWGEGGLPKFGTTARAGKTLYATNFSIDAAAKYDEPCAVECLEPIAMSKRPIPNLEAASFVGRHSVAFLLPDQGAPGGVCLRASGSLVTFDHRYFVLTATYVWARLRKSPIIHCSAIATLVMISTCPERLSRW